MRRRDFITLLGGATTWPLAARAQQPRLPVVGYINTGSLRIATEGGQALSAFQQGLAEAGYAEGRNVAIEYRWADEIYDRLPAMFDDLERRQVSVIVVTGGAMPFVREKAVSATIPVVFTTGVDPVRAGFVASLNRPGGNITGASFFSSELGPKRLELLHQLVPKASSLAVLLNPLNPNFEPQTKLLSSGRDVSRFLAARRLGRLRCGRSSPESRTGPQPEGPQRNDVVGCNDLGLTSLGQNGGWPIP